MKKTSPYSPNNKHQCPDTVSWLSGMSGEANENDVVSAYTQVNMSDASRLLKLPETECTTVWITHTQNCRPKRWDNIDDSMVPKETPSPRPSIGRVAVGKKIGRAVVARKLGESTQLGTSLCSSSSSTLLIRNCRRHHNGWEKC